MQLNPADHGFLETLCAALPAHLFRQAEPRHLEEPRGRWAGQAAIVAMPETTEQVSAVIAAAHRSRVGVVPFGGGTGLVGGQVKGEGPAPLILSLERMDAIRSIYPEENILIVEAGAILADIQAAAAAQERLFPLSLASEGSSRIGGNLATNAGGVNVLRYGNARNLCIGIEAVLPDGQIYQGLTRLYKDNTGYDLRNLLIGSEGSLGIITAAALKLSPRPRMLGTAILTVPSPAAALRLLSLARAQIGEGLSAFELMHRQGLDFLSEHLPDVRQPFKVAPEWMVLIDLGLSAREDPQQILSDLFECAYDQGLVQDGMIAQSEAQRADFWAVRERMPEANRLVGAVSNHDISLPLSALPAFIEAANETIARIGPFRVNCFGHLGDGNLHYNVFPDSGKTRQDYEDLRPRIKTDLHDLVHEMHGSVSAEHGIGRLKIEDLERYGDPAKLAAMRAIKTALDPHGIMNPGAVLRLKTL